MSLVKDNQNSRVVFIKSLNFCGKNMKSRMLQKSGKGRAESDTVLQSLRLASVHINCQMSCYNFIHKRLLTMNEFIKSYYSIIMVEIKVCKEKL